MSTDPTVLVTLSGFRRRLIDDDRSADVELEPGLVRWLGEQSHAGENTGDTDTRVIFVELKEPAAATTTREAELGPTTG